MISKKFGIKRHSHMEDDVTDAGAPVADDEEKKPEGRRTEDMIQGMGILNRPIWAVFSGHKCGKQLPEVDKFEITPSNKALNKGFYSGIQ